MAKQIFKHQLPQFRELIDAMRELPGDISLEGFRSGYKETFRRLDEIPTGGVAKQFYQTCRAQRRKAA